MKKTIYFGKAEVYIASAEGQEIVNLFDTEKQNKLTHLGTATNLLLVQDEEKSRKLQRLFDNIERYKEWKNHVLSRRH